MTNLLVVGTGVINEKNSEMKTFYRVYQSRLFVIPERQRFNTYGVEYTYILQMYAICLHIWMNINYGMQPVAADHSTSFVFSLNFQQKKNAVAQL